MSSTASASASASSSAKASATPIGVLQGQNPLVYSTTDPLILFCVQAFIILVTCRLLHWPLSKIRQPRVIAEVIGGILLGPSVMGHVPNFTATIFPTASIPALTLVANLGLVFFLFIVGLEVDLRVMFRNFRVALSVSVAGMIVPFALGVAIAIGIYNTFATDSPIGFGIYLLFIGVSFSITAFPVLARILTELKLLQTSVGIIVLSAGVGNDVTGWVLLALTVALVNAASGVTVVYVILLAIAVILLLCFVVRPVFIWAANRSGGLQRGPSEMMMAVIVLLVLVVAFYTDIIGIHPIFGGFLVGLIIPHEHGYAVRVTEKIEDFISTLFLPLYFALSGLKTNLGLLDSGIVWGYTIGIILVALFSKILGSTIAARLNGMVWREAFTIGVLMSCKGLVELIVLNVGLSAGILSQLVFTMFVVMALVTTFLTTPITTFLYPPWYQIKIEAWRRGEIDWDGNPLPRPSDDQPTPPHDEKVPPNQPLIKKCMVVLNRMEDLPTMMTITKLLATAPRTPAPASTPISPDSTALKIHCLRLMELTQRTSAVMKVSERHFDRLDPVVNVFRTFGKLNEVLVTAKLAIVPDDSFPDSVQYQAVRSKSEMVIVPWSSGMPKTAAAGDEFIRVVLDKVESHVAVMIDTTLHIDDEPSEPSLSRSISVTSLRNRAAKSQPSTEDPSPVVQLQEGYQIFLPYFGGRDDHVALKLVLQLLHCTDVTATIVRIRTTPEQTDLPSPTPAHIVPETPASPIEEKASSPIASAMTSALAKVKFPEVLHHRSQLTAQPDAETQADDMYVQSLLDSLTPEIRPQIHVETVDTTTPLQYAVKRANREIALNGTKYHLMIAGRGGKYARVQKVQRSLRRDLVALAKGGQSEMVGKSALGDVGEALLFGDVSGGILVVQSAKTEDHE